MWQNFCKSTPLWAEVGGPLFLKNTWKKIYLAVLPCFILTANPALLIPSSAPAHQPGSSGKGSCVGHPCYCVLLGLTLAGLGPAAQGCNLEPGWTLPFPATEVGEGLEQEKQGGSFSLSLGGNPRAAYTFLTWCQGGQWAAPGEPAPGPEGSAVAGRKLQLPAKGNTRL